MDELPKGLVTLLFTDIEETTHLLRRGDEGYADVLEACRLLLRTAFQQYRGHEVDSQVNTFLVVFAYATDAISAAISAQRTLITHTWPNDLKMRVQMILHTGSPRLAVEGYIGLDFHRDVDFMNIEHSSQILLSQTTLDQMEYELPSDVNLHDLGVHRLKGLEHPTHLFQLIIEGLNSDLLQRETLDTHLTNLPNQPTAFIGREKEVASVQQKLLREDVRLVTLTGPGGVGKTRLGLQVAAEVSEHFADGTWFVSLAPITDHDLVIQAIAHTLGVREATGRSLLDQLKVSLGQKQILLVLDNFEQVVSAANQVADLLSACPQLTVLVTSREMLNVQAEQEFPVPQMALPDRTHLSDLTALSQYEAVALFIERARAVKPDFKVTNTNAPSVAEICVRLDGLPLAIELAATRIKLFPPQALLARLEQRLPLLTRSARDVPERQQTLRKTIQWSYDLLTAQEQRLYRQLSVFDGGCSWQAIEAITASLNDQTVSVLDVVTSLIDKNLLRQTSQDGEEVRLMMLETIREFGLELLTITGEMATAREAHATYYLSLAEEAARGYNSPQLAEWLEQLELEHDNLRTTMEWSIDPIQSGSHIEMAYRLGGALKEFWYVRGFHSEARAFLERVLARSEEVSASLRAMTLDVAASFAYERDDYDRAEALWHESLAIYRKLDDIRGISSSLKGIGETAQKKGDYNTAILRLEESFTLYKKIGDPKSIAWSLFFLADGVSGQGDYRRGYTLFEESLTIFRELRNKRGIASCLCQSALWLFFSAQGDQETIDKRLEESLTIFKELGDKVGMAFYCWVKGWAAFKQGDTAMAYNLIERALKLSRETESRRPICATLAFLGRIKAQQGDFAAAHTLLKESLAEAHTLEGGSRAFCLERLAVVVGTQGEHVWATCLLSVGESLRKKCGTPATPAERSDFEPVITAARTILGEKAFVSAWAEGHSMTFDQVLTMLGRSTTTSLDFTEHVAKAIIKQATYPAGLTTREVEVLRLVAQGIEQRRDCRTTRHQFVNRQGSYALALQQTGHQFA